MAIENFRFTHDDKYPTVKELYEVLKSDAEAVGEKYPEEKTVRNSLKDIGFMVNKETRWAFARYLKQFRSRANARHLTRHRLRAFPRPWSRESGKKLPGTLFLR